MNKAKNQKLNTRLLAVFFSAVFLLSLGHFFVYFRLMKTVEQEEQTINYQRMSNAAEELDAIIREIRLDYISLTNEDVFKKNGENLSFYELTELCENTRSILNNAAYFNNWLLFFPGSEYVVTKNGWYPKTEYFTRFLQNETYSADFWMELLEESFLQKYYPEAEFRTLVVERGYSNEKMLPLVL